MEREPCPIHTGAPKICVPSRHNACYIGDVKKIFVIMKKAKETLELAPKVVIQIICVTGGRNGARQMKV